jgi:hypothetical protein
LGRCGDGDATGRGRWRMVVGASHHGLVTMAGLRWQTLKMVRTCDWPLGWGRHRRRADGDAVASGRVRRKKMIVGKC